ncbi:hypothetical protein Tco_0335682 [Tanacetum coccineum]
MIQQVFLTKEVVVYGMEKNLASPQGVTTGKHKQELKPPEPMLLFFNGNYDLGFQKVNKYRLATTVQLLGIHKLIDQDSDYENTIAAKFMLMTESRHDLVEAREIVEENLDDYNF